MSRSEDVSESDTAVSSSPPLDFYHTVLDDKRFSNLLFKFDGCPEATTYVDKIVLCQLSHYFARLLLEENHDTSVIKISDFEPFAVRAVLRTFYGMDYTQDHSEYALDELPQIYVVAKKFELHDLQRAVVEDIRQALDDAIQCDYEIGCHNTYRCSHRSSCPKECFRLPGQKGGCRFSCSDKLLIPSLRLAFSETAQDDDMLRPMIVGFCSANLRKLRKRKDFVELLQQYGELSTSVLLHESESDKIIDHLGEELLLCVCEICGDVQNPWRFKKEGRNGWPWLKKPCYNCGVFPSTNWADWQHTYVERWDIASAKRRPKAMLHGRFVEKEKNGLAGPH